VINPSSWQQPSWQPCNRAQWVNARVVINVYLAMCLQATVAGSRYQVIISAEQAQASETIVNNNADPASSGACTATAKSWAHSSTTRMIAPQDHSYSRPHYLNCCCSAPCQPYKLPLCLPNGTRGENAVKGANAATCILQHPLLQEEQPRVQGYLSACLLWLRLPNRGAKRCR
jgi:hypothetical protein